MCFITKTNQFVNRYTEKSVSQLLTSQNTNAYDKNNENMLTTEFLFKVQQGSKGGKSRCHIKTNLKEVRHAYMV